MSFVIERVRALRYLGRHIVTYAIGSSTRSSINEDIVDEVFVLLVL